MDRNIYLVTKIFFLILYWTKSEFNFEVALDPVVGIVFGVGENMKLLNLFQSTQHGQKHICGY